MSNHWLRLWHDMPTDPKWRTIARVSKQPISLVISVYVHLMVSASRNVTRGHADVTPEDLASALDVTEDEILSVIDAMQNRVLDVMYLSGWETRQPKREDAGNEKTGAKSATERKREQRAREKEAQALAECHADHACATQGHELSRIVTTDKDTEENISTTDVVDKAPGKRALLSCPAGVDETVWQDFAALRKAKKSPLSATALQGIEREAVKAGLSLEAVLSMCCSRGWAGFKAEWLNKTGATSTPTKNGAAMASYGTIFTTPPEGQGNGRTIDATPRLG